MNSTQPTPGTYERVPSDFGEYLAGHQAGGQRRCDQCWQNRDCWLTPDHDQYGRLNPMAMCEGCLRVRHAYDCAEEQAIFRMVGGMVRSAVEAAAAGSIPGTRERELVRAAFDAALVAVERGDEQCVPPLG